MQGVLDCCSPGGMLQVVRSLTRYSWRTVRAPLRWATGVAAPNTGVTQAELEAHPPGNPKLQSPRGWLGRYEEFMRTGPYITSIFTCGVLVALSNIVMQLMVGRRPVPGGSFDFVSLSGMALYGFFFCGPANVIIYSTYDTLYPPGACKRLAAAEDGGTLNKTSSPSSSLAQTSRTRLCQPPSERLLLAAAKVGTDQIFTSPIIYIPAFYIITGVVAKHSPAQILATLRSHAYIASVKSSWLVFIPGQSVNFLCVPVQLRIPFSQLLAFGAHQPSLYAVFVSCLSVTMRCWLPWVRVWWWCEVFNVLLAVIAASDQLQAGPEPASDRGVL